MIPVGGFWWHNLIPVYTVLMFRVSLLFRDNNNSYVPSHSAMCFSSLAQYHEGIDNDHIPCLVQTSHYQEDINKQERVWSRVIKMMKGLGSVYSRRHEKKRIFQEARPWLQSSSKTSGWFFSSTREVSKWDCGGRKCQRWRQQSGQGQCRDLYPKLNSSFISNSPQGYQTNVHRRK